MEVKPGQAPAEGFNTTNGVDPLYYGRIELSEKQMTPLTSGSGMFNQLEDMVAAKQNISGVLTGPADVMGLFNTVFPEVAKYSDVGRITKQDFEPWEEGHNDIIVEVDPREVEATEPKLDVYVGGPAAICAATIQARSDESKNVLYAHDGLRGTSNWKGSASYFHVRDAIPVYYWPDNHGAYVLYATLLHAIQRRVNLQGYINDCSTNANWNKLRLSYVSFFKKLGISFLFAKNQLRALRDVGLHIQGTALAEGSDSTAYCTMHHAHLSHLVFSKLNPPKPIIMQSAPAAKTMHLHVGDHDYDIPNSVFKGLASVGGERIESRKLTTKELTDRGYDPNFVTQALEFPRDGYFPPYIGDVMEDMIKEGGGQVEGTWKLTKVMVRPGDAQDAVVTRVKFEDMITGQPLEKAVKTLYLSLGPSCTTMKVMVPEESNTAMKNLLPGNTMQTMMWASGSSYVFMVKADPDIVPESHFSMFRDHVDAHNKHIVRLGEREVVVDGKKKFRFFCLQTTGGGHFPIKDAHPETALNVFRANVTPILGLGTKAGIEYDIVQLRSCARGITAANVFRIACPAANMVQIYGIGGIGMTTMGPNGLLLKAVLGMRQQVATGELSATEFKRRLSVGDFRKIPHWPHANPFKRNYAQFVDNIRNPKVFAKKFGWAAKRAGPAGSLKRANNFQQMFVRLVRAVAVR